MNSANRCCARTQLSNGGGATRLFCFEPKGRFALGDVHVEPWPRQWSEHVDGTAQEADEGNKEDADIQLA